LLLNLAKNPRKEAMKTTPFSVTIAAPAVVCALGLLQVCGTAAASNETARGAPKSPPRERSFVITNLGMLAVDPNNLAEDCPRGFTPGPDKEVALSRMPPALAAELRKPDNYQKMIGSLWFRGPKGENVCANPSIVPPTDPDATYYVAEGTTGLGFDLDGDDGTGKVPENVCKHKNLLRPKGGSGVDATFNQLSDSHGIDNQSGRFSACVEQRRPKTGYLPKLIDDAMQNSNSTLILQVRGMDDPQNDDEVEIFITGSNDAMKKSGDSSQIVPDYTFVMTADPKAENSFRAKLVNGVVSSTEVKELRLYRGTGAGAGGSGEVVRVQTISSARIRFQISKDGVSVAGLIGGYEPLFMKMPSGGAGNRTSESLAGPYRCPGVYYALPREADGGYDPKTKQCTTMSTAMTFQGVRAFALPPEPGAVAPPAAQTSSTR
jgi:hypothetical protein